MEKKFQLIRKIAFFNILKWFFASTLIGIIVGIFNAMFLKLLGTSLSFTNKFPYYYFALPIGLYIVNILARKVYPRDTDFSTNDAIASINERRPISIISSVKAFFLPIITIAVGGSAGKESPCADVGAGIASFFSRLFSFNSNERRKLMICGVSAGFAGVFGVPISGALFGLEVLSVGTVFYEVMFPAFISGITAFQVTQMLGVEYIYHPMTLSAVNIDGSLLQLVAAGIFFGLISILFIEIIKLTKILFRFISIRFSLFWKCFIGAAILIAIALLASPVYLGLSMERVDAILAGDKAATFGFLFKMITTAVTFAAGGVGGMITPVLFIGANAGYFFADILGLNTVTFAALGIVAVLAGVANTPLSASVMAIELFGASIAPHAAVTCIVSFLVTGHSSLYSKQHFSFDKSLADDEDGKPKQPTIKQLQHTLKRKNIFLAMVRHLIPEVKQNALKNKMDFEQELKRDFKQEVKEELKNTDKPLNAGEKKEVEKKAKKAFSFLNHLFPSIPNIEPDKKESDGKKNKDSK